MTALNIWVRSGHQLFTAGLHLLLRGQGHAVQLEAPGAHVCLHDLHYSALFPLPRPELPTLALVDERMSPETLVTLLGAGYRGYLRPGADLHSLTLALEAVARGELWAERSVLTQTIEQSRLPRLTTREQEVLHYLRRGWSNTEVARQLGIKVKTVKTHVSAVFAKLGVRDRMDLVVNHQDGAAPPGVGADGRRDTS